MGKLAVFGQTGRFRDASSDMGASEHSNGLDIVHKAIRCPRRESIERIPVSALKSETKNITSAQVNYTLNDTNPAMLRARGAGG